MVLIGISIALGSLISAAVLANYATLRRAGVGGEFLLQWKAARSYLFDRIEPYSSSVSGFVQENVYGRVARQGEDPYILDLPFHLVLFSLPVGLFRDPALAGAMWFLILQLALFGLTWASLRLTGWQPVRGFLIAFYLFAVVNLYSVVGLLQASPVLLLASLFALILVTLEMEMDELTGALLALAAYQWQVGLPFIAFVILRVWDTQRWRVLAGFGMVTVVLGLISLFVFPGWFLPFLRAVATDLRFDYGFSVRASLSTLFPRLGDGLGLALMVLSTVLMLLEWSAARREVPRRFYWAACLTLAFTPLLGFRVELENLVVLLIPLALIFSVVRERWKVGYWLAGLLLLLVLLVPWALLVGPSFMPAIRQDLVFLFLPLFTVIGLYWTRWWAVRAPRTWLERAVNTEFR